MKEDVDNYDLNKVVYESHNDHVALLGPIPGHEREKIEDFDIHAILQGNVDYLQPQQQIYGFTILSYTEEFRQKQPEICEKFKSGFTRIFINTKPNPMIYWAL